MFITSKHISLNPISINIENIIVRGDQMAQLYLIKRYQLFAPCLLQHLFLSISVSKRTDFCPETMLSDIVKQLTFTVLQYPFALYLTSRFL